MKNFELIEAIDLESDLNPEYFRMLSRQGQRASFEPGQYIFHQGEKGEYVFILTEGTLKTTRTDEKGHDTLLKIHQVGSLVGLSALRPKATRDANCLAVQNATARQFARSEFLHLIRLDGELGLLLIQILLKRQQLLHSRVSDVTGLNVEQRLARVLVQMHLELVTSGVTSDPPSLRITHEELAALVFSRRQYITSILRGLSGRGLIENKRQQVRVLDIEGLAQVVSE